MVSKRRVSSRDDEPTINVSACVEHTASACMLRTKPKRPRGARRASCTAAETAALRHQSTLQRNATPTHLQSPIAPLRAEGNTRDALVG